MTDKPETLVLTPEDAIKPGATNEGARDQIGSVPGAPASNKAPVAPTPKPQYDVDTGELIVTPEAKAAAEAEEAAAAAKAKEEAEAKLKEESAANDDLTDEEKAAKELEAENTPLDVAVWGDTQSEVGNASLQLLQNSGISTEDAKELLFDAVMEGDVSKIDAAALEEKVGKVKATLILSGAKTFIQERADKINSISTIVHEAAGSKETWDTMAAWAGENMSEAEMSEVSSLIDAGGAKAKFAVHTVLTAYNNDESNTTLETPRAEATSSAAPQPTVGITRADLVKQLDKVYNSNLPDAQKNRQMAAIRAARKVGQSQGI